MRAKHLMLIGCLFAAWMVFAPSQASAQDIVKVKGGYVVTGAIPGHYSYSGPRMFLGRPSVLYPRLVAPTILPLRQVFVYPPHIAGGVTYFYTY